MASSSSFLFKAELCRSVSRRILCRNRVLGFSAPPLVGLVQTISRTLKRSTDSRYKGSIYRLGKSAETPIEANLIELFLASSFRSFATFSSEVRSTVDDILVLGGMTGMSTRVWPLWTTCRADSQRCLEVLCRRDCGVWIRNSKTASRVVRAFYLQFRPIERPPSAPHREQ